MKVHGEAARRYEARQALTMLGLDHFLCIVC